MLAVVVAVVITIVSCRVVFSRARAGSYVDLLLLHFPPILGCKRGTESCTKIQEQWRALEALCVLRCVHDCVRASARVRDVRGLWRVALTARTAMASATTIIIGVRIAHVPGCASITRGGWLFGNQNTTTLGLVVAFYSRGL